MTTKTNIEEKLLRLTQEAYASGKVKPGAVLHVLLAHDNNCPAATTQTLMDCLCDPIIKIVDPKKAN